VRIVDCQEENQFTWHSPIAHSLGFIPSLAALLVLLLKVEPPAIFSSRHAGFSSLLLFTARSAPQLSGDIVIAVPTLLFAWENWADRSSILRSLEY
jgi:hypothetical protein